MADLTGPNPDEINGVDAADAVLTAKPVYVGGVASTALPSAMSADGDAVGLWLSRNGAANIIIRDTAGAAVAPGVQFVEDTALGSTPQGTLVMARRDDALTTLTPVQDDAVGLRVGDKGALWVEMSDGSGNQIGEFGAATQKVEDAALGAVGTPTGTLVMGRAAAAAPTSVSADADASSLWTARFGALNIIPRDTAGLALTTTAAALADAFANPTVGGGSTFPLGFGGTTWDRLRTTTATDGTGALTVTGVQTAGVGPGFDRRFAPANLATANNSTSAVNVNGASIAMVELNTNTTGTLTFEGTVDGSTWIGAVTLDVQAALWQTGVAVGVVVGKVYLCEVGGFQQFRLRTVSTLGSTAAHQITLSLANPISWLPQFPGVAATSDGTGNSSMTNIASYLMGFNGTNWDRVRVANTGRLQVDVITGGGGGTQYVGDAAATATPTGTMQMGLANAAAPTDVSANNDAVAAWLLRSGSQVVTLSAAGALIGGDATGGLHAQGAIAHDAVDSGNPLKIGGRADTGVPTAVSSGDRVNAWLGQNGQLAVALVSLTGSGPVIAAPADAQSAATLTLHTTSYLELYNGTTFDRARSEAGTTGVLMVGGSIAHDSVDAGNPVKVGGRAQPVTGPTAVADNDRADFHVDHKGRLGIWVTSHDGTTGAAVNAAGDSIAGGQALSVQSNAYGYNGGTWDRGRTITALSTAPNVDTGIIAVGTGPGWDRKVDPAGVAATSTSNAVTTVTNGAGVMRFHVTTIGVTPGSMIIEVTGDDTNWITAEVYKANNDSVVNGAFVPAVNDIYVVSVAGYRQVRYRVNAVYASGTATIKVTASAAPLFVRTMALSPSAGTKSNVAAATSSTTLLAANGTRMGATIWNDSSSILYLDTTGGTASATSATVKMAAGAYYELPVMAGGAVYTGLITGIWVSAAGSARIVEHA